MDRDDITKVTMVILIIVCFVGLVICIIGFLKEIGHSRLGEKLEYWLSEPNKITDNR